MNSNASNLGRILKHALQVIADLDEATEHLHSAIPVPPSGGIGFASLGPPKENSLPSIKLASLPGPGHRSILQNFANADSAKRRELLDREERISLFSIVFALYRPGPAFRRGHMLEPNALRAKIAPGGQTWTSRLAAIPSFEKRLPQIARHCPRLDTIDGVVTGSGFLLQNESIMTARHVVKEPGMLFGKSNYPANVRYNQINDPTTSPLDVVATGPTGPDDPAIDMATILQAPEWKSQVARSPLASEFANLRGLPLHSDPLDESELRGRAVAVIGHPVQGNAGGNSSDTAIVYGDAEMNLKRFMPGFLDSDKPVVKKNGATYLAHDCSTLGGASGSCLVDLSTGKVLGIHVMGNTTLGNLAVPIWVLPGITRASG